MKKKHQILYWWLPLLSLCLLAYWIQINVYLNKDVAILSHTAALMLKGQAYAHDIFEPNPPLIFYLHFLPLMMSSLTNIKILYMLRMVMIGLIFGSIACSHYLFKQLFKSSGISNTWLINVMSFGLAGILLFLPADSFEQREHFLLIFTIPYFLLTACRLDDKPIKKSAALLIGVMGGIGFSIKPFFLPTFVLIELLWMYRQKNKMRGNNKNKLGSLRIESLSAGLIIVMYGLCVLLFYPDYLHIVIPLWLPYYRGIIWPWINLFTYPLFIWCCAALALSCFIKKEEPNATLKRVFAISIVGFLIAFLIPQVMWYYHVLPALSMSFLYFILLFGELTQPIKGTSKRLLEIVLLTLMAMVVFSLPIIQSIVLTTNAITYFHSNSPINRLIVYLNQHSRHNTYTFFSMTHSLYDLEFYSTAQYVGTFSFCVWEYSRLAPERYSVSSQQDTRSYALKLVTHDLNDKKPEFVIVDIPSSENYLHQTIDYPKEYALDKNFHEAWSHYEYLRSFKPYDIYQRMK